VLFIVLEGSRYQVANRLESLISRVLYRNVKRGDIDPEVYQQLLEEYHELKRLLVVRGMTDAWSYTVADIRAELDELKSSHGWVPDQLVVDYGDLLRSQEKGNLSEEQHQRDAFGDLKTLSSQDNGYSIWTASQSRRPAPTANERQKGQDIVDSALKPVIEPRAIADSYNKVRRADFIGSINQDAEEQAQHMARLWCAMYRDNPARVLCTVKQDLDRMVFADLLDPSNRDIPSSSLGRFANVAKRSEFAFVSE
jgi:replicative DNA helicase